jgi:putative tricarboxylic transport membrane protein
MKALEIATAVALLVLSAVIAVATRDLPYWADFAPGPAFAAFWVAGVGALIGILLLIQALRHKMHEPVEWPDRAGASRVLFAAAALFLFILVLPWLGFALGALLFLLTMLIAVQRRRLIPAMAATAVTVVVVYSVFVVWLRIDLPKGLVGF